MEYTGINRCSNAYSLGKISGELLALLAYTKGAIPKELTHFTTTEANAAKILKEGINPSLGLFGHGRYAAETGRLSSRLLVKRQAKVGVPIDNTSGYLRTLHHRSYIHPTMTILGHPVLGVWGGIYIYDDRC